MAKRNVMGGKNKIASQKYQKRITKTGMVCNKCKKDKLKSEYGVNKSWCLPCVRIYQQQLRKKQRERLW